MHRSVVSVASSILPKALVLLLVLACLTGGGSYDRGWGDALVELLAWPVLVVAVLALSEKPLPKQSLVLLLAAFAVPLVLALQWLTGWSETPWATERGLWSVMPAVAMFAGALALGERHYPGLLWVVAGLVGFNVVLAFLQLGAPQDSLLNPFPEWPPALGGVFANANHHGTVLSMALLWLGAWAWSTWRTRGKAFDGRKLLLWVIAAASSLILLAVLPLTGSRAMVLIAMGALLAVPVLLGGLRDLRSLGRSRRSVALAMTLLIAGALLLVAVSGWLKVDSEQEIRGTLAATTARMAADAMPWGHGLGSFVPWFDAHAGERFALRAFANHAHNEYVQWWLESGVFGLAWIAMLVAWLLWACPWPNASRGVQPAPAVAAWLSVAVVLAHSAVDYPLRTQGIMAIFAFMAGMASSYALRRSRGASTETAPPPTRSRGLVSG